MTRNILIALAMLSAAAASGAQETQTLLGSDIRHGGFGGPVVKFTQVDGEFGVLVGGRGGWIINDSFVLGAGGYGLVNEGSFDNYFDVVGDRWKLLMGYGGLEMEYILRPNEVAHVSLAVLVGAGGVLWDPFGWDHHNWEDDVDAFFVAEPELNVLFNVTKHFRVGLGGSFRFVGDVELNTLDNGDIAGPAGVVTIKLGGF